jgi:hypothetical protein
MSLKGARDFASNDQTVNFSRSQSSSFCPKVQYQGAGRTDTLRVGATDLRYARGDCRHKAAVMSKLQSNHLMKNLAVTAKFAPLTGLRFAIILLSLAGCSNQDVAFSVKGKPVSGYVRMTQVQAAYIGSGNAGNGVLDYHGDTYPFTVGGLGVGGIGVSKIEAYGEVYGLEHLRDFAGAYAQARYGFALGRASTGELWLQNNSGVIMHLKAKREGLMLSLGGDAVVIQMNQ